MRQTTSHIVKKYRLAWMGDALEAKEVAHVKFKTQKKLNKTFTVKRAQIRKLIFKLSTTFKCWDLRQPHSQRKVYPSPNAKTKHPFSSHQSTMSSTPPKDPLKPLNSLKPQHAPPPPKQNKHSSVWYPNPLTKLKFFIQAPWKQNSLKQKP